ncbi:putative phage protein gp47/JayE [Erwinia persicina]|nr:putative phage protein gp47/JayE [Erwinia persicina]
MADSGFSRPTLPQLITTIRSDILTRLTADSTLAALRRTDAEVYGRVQAAAVYTVYGYIDYLARNLLPDMADKEWLVRHANMKRCPRKAATYAAGYVRWDVATNGIEIPAGVTIQRDDLVSFTTSGAVRSAGGVLRVPVICDVAGSTGNTDDGLAMRLTSPVTGLASAAVADSIQGGADIEDLEV